MYKLLHMQRTDRLCLINTWGVKQLGRGSVLQAALDRFAFMTPTTALGVLIALQPLALLKKHIQVQQALTSVLSCCHSIFMCHVLCHQYCATRIC